MKNKNEDIEIELASCDEITLLTPYVDKVLEALGHEDALVTDESIVCDFLCFCDKEEAEKELKLAVSKLNMDLIRSDRIVDIARRLKDDAMLQNR